MTGRATSNRVPMPNVGQTVTITIGDGRRWAGTVDKRYGGKITLRRHDAHWTTTIYEADITKVEW